MKLKMDSQNSPKGQVIEVTGDVPTETSELVANKVCGGAVCGFSDSETLSKDAKERSVSIRKLIMEVVLCVIFMSVEVAGGIKANSLAILTDAAHLSDVADFAISLFSLWAAGWEATPRQSYGFFRIEILGALVSIQLIWLLAGILVYEAIDRLIRDTGEVDGFLMFVVAAFGLLVNIIMALLLRHDHGHSAGHGHSHSHDHGHSHGGHNHDHEIHGHGGHDHSRHGEHSHSSGAISIRSHNHQKCNAKNKDEQVSLIVDVDSNEPLLKSSEEKCESEEAMKPKQKEWNINVQGAYLHVLGDSIQSIGVMIGGAIIWCKPEWKIIDVICTLIFSVIVLGTTIKMLRNILEVLMESTPREIDATRLEKGLCEMDGVVAIHELHIWAITVGKVLLACHVTITREANADLVLDKVVDYIRREYNISHVTIQIERL